MKENNSNERANIFSRAMKQAPNRIRQNTLAPHILKEERIIERELRSNIDETEDNLRPRTPPNIKLQDYHQSEDFFAATGNSNSNDRFTENYLKIDPQPMRRNMSSNPRRRSSGLTQLSARLQSEVQNDAEVKNYLQEMVSMMTTKD